MRYARFAGNPSAQWYVTLTRRLACSVAAALVLTAAVYAQGERVLVTHRLPPNIATAIATSSARVIPATVNATAPRPPIGANVDTTTVHHLDSMRVPIAASEVVIKRGQFLAARLAEKPILITPPRATGQSGATVIGPYLALPERFVGFGVDSDVAYLRPAFLAQGQLRYDVHSQYFRGAISVGLEDTVQRTVQRKLAGGIHFQFGGTDVDSVSPGGIDVDHTNLPLAAIAVLVRNPADSVQLRIITAADVNGTNVWLRAVPALDFGRLHPDAQGFGLERIPTAVSILGTRRTTPIKVKLTADHGTIEPQVIMLGSGRDTTVLWNTGRLGIATIQATADEIGADIGYASVNFAFPFIFLTAAVLGGAAGAALKQLGGGGGGKSMGRVLATGILAGVVAAAIYCAIDVSILPIPVNVPFFNEGAVFALAALAGLLGIRLAGKSSKSD